MRILLALLLCVVAVPAFAQDAPSADEEKAKALYARGVTHYDLAEYDQAIEAFRQAYALGRRPNILFNIAQAYRLKGDCPNALTFYKNYLRTLPEAENRAKVEERIAEMQECAAKATPPPPPPREPITEAPREEVKPEVVQPPPVATERSGGGTKKILGLVAAGVGVAALGTGVYFTTVAEDKVDEATAGCSAPAPCDWNQSRADAADEVDSARSTATILYVAGGVAVAGGAVLYWLGAREAAASSDVAFVPLRGGGLASAQFRF